ncbi:MAG TPA: cellulase family glycosylhydrolase [Phycisphaerae bacterium]|nr:cellulase family glycosylhydrolase [Phycisphaerae bacterium]HRY69979.1 cellulase family glycosylhydrolase [Phycisphaerae bacterium]HSA27188.1 cellulase family glycosylhydrolase [Phycisphaerae bacterium]
MKRGLLGWMGLAVFLGAGGCSMAPPGGSEPFEHFVRRDGDRLLDGDREFRFVSFNIPNLHYVEDDMRFDRAMPFRLPDAFEIEDALGSIAQLGGQVVRMYALSVKKPDDPADIPRYILGPGQFNEEAFVILDQVLAAASRHRVRVIIPFIDQWVWWGGTGELAGFRGKKGDDFFTDPQLIEDYKAIVTTVVNRRNTITGIRYRDDKAILAWETGNELKAPENWTRIAAAHIKSVDPNHLVIDGAGYGTLPQNSLKDPNVDFVQTHHYEPDPRQVVQRIAANSDLARGHKPYHVGEFGFLSTEALRSIIDTVIERKITGALLWSLRCRSRDGGFYWHHEPLGGDFFKAYHWPGFASGERYDERGLMSLLRAKAFEIRGLTPPPLPAPKTPTLLTVDNGGMISWQGSVGAASYDIQRAPALLGPWKTIATDVSEADVQYRPLYVDDSARPGESYHYRVLARNHSGMSEPSNTVGPVRIDHRTLVDEFRNDSRIYLKQGKVQFRENEARKFKEDCHRLAGERDSGVVYRAADGIRMVRLFVYTLADQQNVTVAFSKDGANFEPAELAVTRTTTYGGSLYGFMQSALYSAKGCGADSRYVKVTFRTEAQIGRVEIEHGRAD